MRLAIAMLALALCIGCKKAPEASVTAPTSQASHVVVGYSAPEWGGAQYQIMQGLRERAEQRKWECIVVNANSDPALQQRQLDYLVGLKVNAIVAVPVDSAGIAPSITKARAADIPFYTIDRAPSRERVNMVVQCDNVMAGRQAGEVLAEFLRKRYGGVLRGTILQLRGEQTQTVSTERERGFLEVFGDQPGVRIVSRDTHWQASLFSRFAAEVLANDPVDAIYLQSDMIGVPEVLPVLRHLGRLLPPDDPRHVFIVGVDGGPPALQAIRDGWVDAVASQPLTEYGVIVEWIAHDLQGTNAKGSTAIPQEPGLAAAGGHLSVTDQGPVLQLPTVLVTRDNANRADLWGNRLKPAPATQPRNEP